MALTVHSLSANFNPHNRFHFSKHLFNRACDATAQYLILASPLAQVRLMFRPSF
ncbi:MAG: hypothetical protein MSG64_13540 [Pyrinomonadaceae bacterium MAG19_C2-C3]|nr:hypothetical protein [Pyrinomonadaceae bacterium MAG19_C2-C3]